MYKEKKLSKTRTKESSLILSAPQLGQSFSTPIFGIFFLSFPNFIFSK
jgi:hypothetical protein